MSRPLVDNVYSNKKQHQVAVLKFIIILFLVLTAGVESLGMVGQRLDYFLDIERFGRASIYLLVVTFAWLGFIATPFMRSNLIRTVIVITFLTGYLVDQIFINVSGNPFSIQIARTFVDNFAMNDIILQAYSSEVFAELIPVLVFMFVLSLPSKGKFSLPNKFATIPITVFLSVIFITQYTYGRVVEFPSFYSVIAKFMEAGSPSLYSGERDKMQYSGEISPKVRHIVLIVDESVRADFMGINNSRINNTPYLAGNRQKFTNFGRVVSSWNCSWQARLILRAGMQAHQLPDNSQKALRQPTIWQFAQHAGYKTIFMDAWRAEGQFHNYMNSAETAHINKSYIFEKEVIHKRDVLMAENISTLLTSKEPSFILVNKFGAHYPFFNSYPPGYSQHDAGPKGRPDLKSNKIHLLNSYHNAIQWSVDGFFEKLLSEAELDNTIVIYTSDHGINLYENGERLTHCNLEDVDKGESLVPLLVMTEQPYLQNTFRQSVRKSTNQMTHFQIFPTLLSLMGFDKKWVQHNYGSDLLSPPPATRSFLTGNLFNDLPSKLRYSKENIRVNVD